MPWSPHVFCVCIGFGLISDASFPVIRLKGREHLWSLLVCCWLRHATQAIRAPRTQAGSASRMHPLIFALQVRFDWERQRFLTTFYRKRTKGTRWNISSFYCATPASTRVPWPSCNWSDSHFRIALNLGFVPWNSEFDITTKKCVSR